MNSPSQADSVEQISLGGRPGYLAAIALTVVLIALHIRVLSSAGPLWRDEILSVNISQLPTLDDVRQAIEFDSFPILWFGVLRVWHGCGFASSDVGFRFLGFLTGCGLLGLGWWAGRQFGLRHPWLYLVLFAATEIAVRYADAVRAFGAGAALNLIVFVCLWRYLKAPSVSRWCTIQLFAFLSVHTGWYNSILLFANCVAAAGTCVVAREWRRACGLLALGIGPALSLLLYVEPLMRRMEWNALCERPVTVMEILQKMQNSPGNVAWGLPWIWLGLFLVTVIGSFRNRSAAACGIRRRQALFLGSSAVLATVCYLLFLMRLSFPTNPWYYLALNAQLAVAMDAALQPWANGRLWRRLMWLGGGVAIAAVTCTAVWSAAQSRMTNADLVAQQLMEQAADDDLIVVSPWYYGVSFDRYYSGAADWATIPPLDDQRLARFDLVKQRMIERGAIRGLCDQIEQTLADGHRVWVVGWLKFLTKGDLLMREPLPPPIPGYGWVEIPYQVYWCQEVSISCDRGGRVRETTTTDAGPVSPFEALRLWEVVPYSKSPPNP